MVSVVRDPADGYSDDEMNAIRSGQIRLLPDPCAICGRRTGLMIEQGGVFACVECHTKENGEDGDSPDDLP